MSIAGGYHRAIDAAEKATCDCVQIFTKNNNQWKAKEISSEAAAKFRDSLEASSVSHPLSHSSYLINLGTPNATLWKKSIDAFVVELQRAELLGIPYVVLHPGAYTDSSEEAGIVAVVAALDEIHSQTKALQFEVSPGDDRWPRHDVWAGEFEQLARMLDGVQDPDRLGVCFDTCHVFAAGLPTRLGERLSAQRWKRFRPDRWSSLG